MYFLFIHLSNDMPHNVLCMDSRADSKYFTFGFALSQSKRFYL